MKMVSYRFALTNSGMEISGRMNLMGLWKNYACAIGWRDWHAFAGSWKRMIEKLDGSCKMRSKEFEGVLE